MVVQTLVIWHGFHGSLVLSLPQGKVSLGFLHPPNEKFSQLQVDSRRAAVYTMPFLLRNHASQHLPHTGEKTS